MREFSLEESQDLFQILSDPEVMHFSFSGPLNEEQVLEQIHGYRESQESWGYARWAVVRQEDERILGYCGFRQMEVEGQQEVELGYRLGSEFWRQGYASEAALACRVYVESKSILNRMIALVHPPNHASCRVAEKTGLSFERMVTYKDEPLRQYAR